MKTVQNFFCAAACGLVLAFATACFRARRSSRAWRRLSASRARRVIRSNAAPTPSGIRWSPGKFFKPARPSRPNPTRLVDLVLGKRIQMLQARPTPDRIAFAPDPLVRGMVDYKPSAEQNMIRLSGDTTLKIDKLTVSDTGVDTRQRHGTGFEKRTHIRQRQKIFRRLPISHKNSQRHRRCARHVVRPRLGRLVRGEQDSVWLSFTGRGRKDRHAVDRRRQSV